MTDATPAAPSPAPSDFIRDIVAQHVAEKRYPQIVTRFPPEPNGYLHIGHAKSICLNFGIARENGGRCNLRMDDTNPTKEDVEYVDSIKEDVHWLGFDWGNHYYHASDYFDALYAHAEQLIKLGKAYVCDQTLEEISASRGNLNEPGKPSPYRDRTVDENLDLFRRMRAGEFADGTRVLRAKVDMASPNMHMRDPVIYRIRHAEHHSTGDKWCIYPMYDFAHCLSDAQERITHSICTLEFDVHRPIYDWLLETLGTFPSHQYEFARLNLTYTVMSKRKLLELVKDNPVQGWDDPRMPTISGLRRRGVTPASIRNFCETIGVTKFNSLTDLAVLEHAMREDLNKVCPRVMAVFNPLKVVITDWPADKVDAIDADNNPEDPSAGRRKVFFTRELYIDADDFMENPPKKFFRLAPGQEVRLRYGYVVKCNSVVKDAEGRVVEVHCTRDETTRGGENPADGRKIRGTIQWVPAPLAKRIPVRIYERLFTVERPDADKERDFKEFLNPDSLSETTALVEPHVVEDACTKLAAAAAAGQRPDIRYQFERVGYFFVDYKDSTPTAPVFNRIIGLKDSWKKVATKE